MAPLTAAQRNLPNIIVTGTPGTGKTAHAEMLAERLQESSNGGEGQLKMRHVSVNNIVKDKECHEGWDDELGCWIVDDDKLLDAMEDDGVEQGGCIIDWHACELFPQRWIDLVVVLRVESSTLYDRLSARKYAEIKLQENLDTEIMDILLQEARDSYNEEIVVELRSDTPEEMETNVDRIFSWLEQWKKDHAPE
ncbi:P-loop containing nucleoside triphosphate hydrolase protein [Zalerion maritima]|uniref:Adenylate kinase isoenzyme 6 homolog n=1 Tax=Zalerion maritima TaxID=339359 RepID=A0AAD5WQR2_9PEZI|nr:P-loop containing nucleoside triphosphate hydrolase protein [Zalerion maritima]